jgi:hypothetical protein
MLPMKASGRAATTEDVVGRGGVGIRVRCAAKAVLAGLLVIPVGVFTSAPAAAATEGFTAKVRNSRADEFTGTDVMDAHIQAADTNPPTVSLTSPGPGSTTSHVVSLAATASDDVGVQSVEFFLDGTTSLGVDTSAPYLGEWDSTTVGNGAHTLTAVARDAAGNGNVGSIGSAMWSTAGRYGNALSFNGSSALVTVPDSPSLRLTSGMTLEAWVSRPS